MTATAIKPAEIPADLKPHSIWLVVYEHRFAAITVSPDGRGFFACGQDPMWPLSEVEEWIMEIGHVYDGMSGCAKCREKDGKLGSITAMLKKRPVRNLIAALKLQPQDTGGPSRMEMLRQRIEAVKLIEDLSEMCKNKQENDHGIRCKCGWNYRD